MEEPRHEDQEDPTGGSDELSGPVTHGGAGDPLGGGVAEPGENEGGPAAEEGAQP